MGKFCGDCGSQTENDSCSACTAKSLGSVNVEALDKALGDLELLSKGVRPADAAAAKADVRDLEEVTESARKQVKKYGAKGEGDTEEEPKTKRGVESAAKGGFMPPPEEEEEEEDPRRREEEEEEEEQGQGRPMPFKSSKSKAKKSMAEEVMEDETVRKAVDVSEFLENMTSRIVKGYDSLNEDVYHLSHFSAYQQKYNVGLAKALGELGSLVKSLTETVQAISKSPAGGRKGDVTIVEKSFAGGKGNETTDESQVISKSAIAGKILALREAGDQTITDLDILRAESTGLVRPEVQKKIGI